MKDNYEQMVSEALKLAKKQQCDIYVVIYDFADPDYDLPAIYSLCQEIDIGAFYIESDIRAIVSPDGNIS